MSKKKNRPSPESFGLERVGIETHAHLDMDGFEAAEVPAVLERAALAGVRLVGNVFLGAEAFFSNRALFDAHPEVFFVLGAHPNDCAGYTDAEMAGIERAFAEEPRLRALGEIGLDFYWDSASPEIQERAFRDQLAFAGERDIPVVIHCREAEEDAFRVLLDMGYRDRPLVWHCFGGDAAMAARIFSYGWHVSVPGPVTYKKNEAVMAAVAGMDLSRVMLETDAPYLTPEPYRGKRNEPAYIVFTAAKIAELMGRSLEEVWSATAANAEAFFGL